MFTHTFCESNIGVDIFPLDIVTVFEIKSFTAKKVMQVILLHT